MILEVPGCPLDAAPNFTGVEPALVHFYACSIFPRYAWKNRKQKMIKYHAAAGDTTYMGSP
jgi:hypothetical protein